MCSEPASAVLSGVLRLLSQQGNRAPERPKGGVSVPCIKLSASVSPSAEDAHRQRKKMGKGKSSNICGDVAGACVAKPIEIFTSKQPSDPLLTDEPLGVVFEAAKLWEAAKPTAAGVPSANFVKAALATGDVFDALGMGVVNGDVFGNAAKIEKNIQVQVQADGVTLEQMVEKELEVAAKVWNGQAAAKVALEGSTSLALLWLNRFLAFMEGTLAAMQANDATPLRQCVQAGYDKGLKRHHGFVVRGAFAVVMKTVPERQQFLKTLSGEAPPEQVGKGLASMQASMSQIVETIDTFLKAKQIELPDVEAAKADKAVWQAELTASEKAAHQQAKAEQAAQKKVAAEQAAQEKAAAAAKAAEEKAAATAAATAAMAAAWAAAEEEKAFQAAAAKAAKEEAAAAKKAAAAKASLVRKESSDQLKAQAAAAKETEKAKKAEVEAIAKAAKEEAAAAAAKVRFAR